MTQALAQAPETKLPVAAGSFDDVARQALALSKSDIIPEAYRGKPSNCLIALEMADRMGCAPLQIMQSMHIIHGRPSFTSQWLIATVNASGRFSPLRWKFREEKGRKVGAIAYASEKESGEVLEGPEVTLEMAKAEGWSTKSGSKWLTMPEVMLMYRSAAFWTRLYCPEVAMGLHTEEEIEDVAEVRQQQAPRSFAAALASIPEAPALVAPAATPDAPEAEYDEETGEVKS